MTSLSFLSSSSTEAWFQKNRQCRTYTEFRHPSPWQWSRLSSAFTGQGTSTISSRARETLDVPSAASWQSSWGGCVEVALSGWGVSETRKLPPATLRQEEALRQAIKAMCQQEIGDPSPEKQTLGSSWLAQLVRGSAGGWNGRGEAVPGRAEQEHSAGAIPVRTVGKEKFPLSPTSWGTEALELTQHRAWSQEGTHKHPWSTPQTQHLPVEYSSVPKDSKGITTLKLCYGNKWLTSSLQLIQFPGLTYLNY